MLVFAPAEEEEISITPEGQADKNSLHMASFQHIPANNKNVEKRGNVGRTRLLRVLQMKM